MRFLYFLPGLQSPRVDGEVAARFGLRDVLRGVRARGCACSGPDGAGVLLVDEREPAAVYLPSRQTWARRLDGLAWTGFWTDARPGPEELLRASQVGGHAVRLGDGASWLVPVARCFPEGTALPQSLRFDGAGVVGTVLPEYAGLWEEACRIWDLEGAADVKDLYLAACRALAVNYHLGVDEVNALALLDSSTVRAAVNALLDIPTIELLRAAIAGGGSDPKAPAGACPGSSPGGSGAKAGSPATTPASPTSAG